MFRKAISLTLACSILGAGLWLLYLQIFEWESINAIVALTSVLMILVGLWWLLGDFVFPFFPRAQSLLTRVDDAVKRGNVALGRGFRKLGSGIVRLFRTVAWLAGLAAVLAALACWGFQGYMWLKNGEWISIPAGAFVDFKSTGWLGVDQILLWLLDFNVGIPLLFAGFGILAISVMDSD